jgi:hypothetical protein
MSVVSCIPEVPPPPVSGAAAGSGVLDGWWWWWWCDGDGDGDGDGEGDGEADAVGRGRAVWGVGLGLGVVGLGLGETVGLPLGEAVAVGEMLPAGENDDDVGSAVGVDPEQAETAPEASMVMAPQPRTVSFALSPVPAMAVLTFTEPPHAPVPESADCHTGNTYGQHHYVLK